MGFVEMMKRAESGEKFLIAGRFFGRCEMVLKDFFDFRGGPCLNDGLRFKTKFEL